MKNYQTIFLNVKFILLSLTLRLIGSEWCQWCWVLPIIKSSDPCFNNIFTGSLDLSFLCRNRKSLSAPKLTDAIIGLMPSSFSSSLCQPIPTLPSGYSFNRTLLNSWWVIFCIRCLIWKRSLSQLSGSRVSPEYEYFFPLSAYHATLPVSYTHLTLPTICSV